MNRIAEALCCPRNSQCAVDKYWDGERVDIDALKSNRHLGEGCVEDDKVDIVRGGNAADTAGSSTLDNFRWGKRGLQRYSNYYRRPNYYCHR